MEKKNENARFSMVKNRHKKRFFESLKKQEIDSQVISLCNFFVELDDFFTSSTCSGRIVLLKVKKDERKHEAAFLAKWHRTVFLQEVLNALLKSTAFETWFKQEPFILHVGCKNLEKAILLLKIAKECGIKRAGINVAKEGKFLLEIIGTQTIAFPIKKGKKMLMEKEKFKYVLDRANEKLEKNYLQLLSFEKQCKQKLK